MRYKLIIKQCVQLVGYNDQENMNPQTIMTMFSSDDQTKIGETAKLLRSLQSNTQIVIYDSNTGARVNVK